MFPDNINDLWARLRDPNDRVASADFAAAVWPPLLAAFHARNPKADPDLVRDAVYETMTGLMKHPRRYDPNKSPLTSYLLMSASGDLQNALERERRCRLNLQKAVERGAFTRKYSSEDERPRLDDYPELRAVRERLSPCDRAVLDLMRTGAEDHELAAALGLAESPSEEQEEAVTRAKGRIIARLRRAGEKL